MFRRLTQALALMATTAAVAAPAADASLPLPDSQSASPADSTLRPLVVTSVEHGGFDYGDAAIGAGAVLVVLLAGGGVTLATRRARRPQLFPASRG